MIQSFCSCCLLFCCLTSSLERIFNFPQPLWGQTLSLVSIVFVIVLSPCLISYLFIFIFLSLWLNWNLNWNYFWLVICTSSRPKCLLSTAKLILSVYLKQCLFKLFQTNLLSFWNIWLVFWYIDFPYSMLVEFNHNAQLLVFFFIFIFNSFTLLHFARIKISFALILIKFNLTAERQRL